MHVFETLLDAADRGELSREVLHDILWEHLAALCPVCAASLAAHRAGLKAPARRSLTRDPDPLARLGRRLGLGERELRTKARTARAWVREIVRLDPGERRGRIHGAYSRFRGPLFGILLLEEARRAIPADPAESLSLAEAALLSCRRTQPDQPDPEIEAAALAVRGNARRALGRLKEAEADLDRAEQLLDAPGLGDPALPAEVERYLGSLRKDQGRLAEAARHLRRAGTLYRLLGDADKATGVLLKLGDVHFRAREVDDAVATVDQALDLLTPDSEPWLRVSAHFNRAYYLHARGAEGDLDAAEAELAAHGDLLTNEGAWGALHLAWLRARIAWSRGDLAAAERLFTDARALTIERGIPFDTSLVSLELALVHLARGRTGKVKTLAVEALGVFAEQEVEREVRAALALAEAAARRDALTRELLEQAITAVERAAHGGTAAVHAPR
ncbi:MAG: hypothetical protein PVG07_14210 [Acidobacteriota bacterium]|jgi:tetratricopeptide (TPR) repeat protein